MNFFDFKDNPQELVGELVLFETGSSTHGTSRSIATIVKVVTGAKHNYFKIKGCDSQFHISNGNERGKNGRLNWGRICECKLLTLQEADALRLQWKKNREIKAMRKRLLESIDKIPDSTLEQIIALLDENKS
jgi:hypothetical protein